MIWHEVIVTLYGNMHHHLFRTEAEMEHWLENDMKNEVPIGALVQTATRDWDERILQKAMENNVAITLHASRYEPTPPKTVSREWGICCPVCRRDDALDVQAAVWVRVTPNGATDESHNGIHEWDNDSLCTCVSCGWSGFARDAALEGPQDVDKKLTQ